MERALLVTALQPRPGVLSGCRRLPTSSTPQDPNLGLSVPQPGQLLQQVSVIFPFSQYSGLNLAGISQQECAVTVNL